MAQEKFWPKVPATALTTDGNVNGFITIADTTGFKVKMVARLTADTLPPLSLEIKRVISSTEMLVGPIGTSIDDREDVSDYTVALNAKISADRQRRPSIPLKEINRAVYEEEPTVAIRAMLVDEDGNPAGGGSGDPSADVNLIQINGTAISNSNAMPSRITDGNDVLDINTDGSINVVSDPNVGIESDLSSNPSGDGLVALSTSSEIELVSIPIPDGTTYNLTGWNWAADIQAQFQLEVRDGITLVENVRTVNNLQGMSNFMIFPRSIEINGATNRVLRITALRLREKSGNASGAINGYKT